VYRSFGDDVTRVSDALGLYQHEMHFVTRHGPVLDALWYDDELTRTERDLAIAELDGEVALDHDEKLVFIFVLMPDELTLNLGQFDLAVVQIRHDFRIPLIVKATEFLGQVDLVKHASISAVSAGGWPK